MKRSLAILAVLAVGSVAVADPCVCYEFKAELDAGIRAGDPNNYGVDGVTCNHRFAKWKQENLASEWSEEQKADIAALLASPPPAPCTHWQVEYRLTLPCWTANNVGAVAWTELFYNSNPWDENTCNDFEASAGVPWDSGSFWGQPAMMNSVPIVGFYCTPAPSDPLHMTGVVLDPPLVQDLLLNPQARGIRTWGNLADYNHNAYLNGQWGDICTPILRVCAVPEPATMLLIAAGGFGLLLRRKR
jgi:hypothetical protein